MKLANSLAVVERAPEAVAVHGTFERWLPGKSPRLSAKFIYGLAVFGDMRDDPKFLQAISRSG